MDPTTSNLCTIFALLRSGRITPDLMRRFAQCPERVRMDWNAATSEQQLREFSQAHAYTPLDMTLEQEMQFWQAARLMGAERCCLILAHQAFVIGAKNGFDLLQARACIEICGSGVRQCAQHSAPLSDDWRQIYLELADIIKRALHGESVSPYEMIIRFEGNSVFYGHPGHIIRQYGRELASNATHRIRSAITDKQAYRIATQHWLMCLERAKRLARG